MIRIGSAQFDSNIFFAPLSGCSDLAFRLITRECGAKFCFFEMVDAHSLVGPHPRKFNILKTVEADAPLGAQLVGEDPQMMLDAAQILLEHVPKVPLLDINSACPVKKVVKKGAGAALLRDKSTLFSMIRLLASSLPVPVTVKLRGGYQKIDLYELEELARACEANGIAAIFIHGRSREQGYSGDVNYEAIRTVKQAVSIPVFGSGNVFDPLLAKTMFDETGCDGILVARGAFGNPWIFGQIEEFLTTNTLPPEASRSRRKQVLKRHLAYMMKFKQNSPAGKIGLMRKVSLWYLKGFPNAAKVRGQINSVTEYERLLNFIDEHL